MNFPVYQVLLVLATVPPAQAITFLALQIPTFHGITDDDIDVWLRKIELTAAIHGVNNNIKLLAAISKLQKLVKN